MGEIWRDIPGYEGLYQISNMGRVKSLPKEWIGGNGVKLKHNGKLLSSSKSGRGYYKINLSRGGKVKTIKVHQLVAMVFLGHKPDGMNIVIDHIDGNKTNNRLDNLQLISQRENSSKDKVGSSKYTGVYWSKPRSKWRSQIIINGQKIYLGLFTDEEKASQMYQLALSNIDKFDGDAKDFRQYLNGKNYTEQQLDEMEYELWLMKAKAFFETEQIEQHGNN